MAHEIPREIFSALEAASNRHKVPITILMAVAKAESGFNPRAVSDKGALGLMQIMPDNVKAYGMKDPFDPVESADIGAKMLARLFKWFVNWPQTLAAYNWGIRNVVDHPNMTEWPSVTQAFVAKVAKYSGVTLPLTIGGTIAGQ
jgi:soluble lytic murein transglycosylase-like protein